MFDLTGKSLLQAAVAITDGEKNTIANLANISALIFSYMDNLNWAGFYMIEDGGLVLGPFQGKPACVRIPLGKGVCGTAAERLETLLVNDVHAFPGHIACDSASMSEIVVPIIKNGQALGVLDVDSPVKDRFTETDRDALTALAALISEMF